VLGTGTPGLVQRGDPVNAADREYLKIAMALLSPEQLIESLRKAGVSDAHKQEIRDELGRRGVRIPDDLVVQLTVPGHATAQIKVEHDRAFETCQKLVTSALISAGAHVKEGVLIETQQLYIFRLRRLRKLIADLYAEPLDLY
jgi:hypothetical protein